MTAESSYQGIFEMCDIKDNRQQQRFLLKTLRAAAVTVMVSFEHFHNYTQLTLEEKSKVLRWVFERVPLLLDNKKISHYSCRLTERHISKLHIRETALLDDNGKLILERKLKAEN